MEVVSLGWNFSGGEHPLNLVMLLYIGKMLDFIFFLKKVSC